MASSDPMAELSYIHVKYYNLSPECYVAILHKFANGSYKILALKCFEITSITVKQRPYSLWGFRDYYHHQHFQIVF